MATGGQGISELLTYAEDGIYLMTAALLAATALVLLFKTGAALVRSLGTGATLQDALRALDSLLLVLMIVELLHTIRLFIVEHALVAEPFLIVALIAGVRRMLILTTEASQYIQSKPEQFRMAMIEMALLVVSFVAISGAILILRQTLP
ncbi:phosphate-starvation-inducible PsiE family protein [Lentisalinibacter sediminis]|uniref:phosphate-starvation-inducible PsiE family protein n=1 Tax=Lentisalinibacter sediminis TaxID=2992237 RepID=UPI00386C7403